MARRVRTYLDGDAQTDEMLRPNRLVSTATCMKVVELLSSDVLPERK